MNWRECGRKGSWPNLRHCFSILMKRLMNAMDPCHNCRCPDPDSNSAAPECKFYPKPGSMWPVQATQSTHTHTYCVVCCSVICQVFISCAIVLL